MHGVETSYHKGACGVSRWECESSCRFDMGICTNRLKSGVVKWVISSTLRWFSHIEKREKFVRLVVQTEAGHLGYGGISLGCRFTKEPSVEEGRETLTSKAKSWEEEGLILSYTVAILLGGFQRE